MTRKKKSPLASRYYAGGGNMSRNPALQDPSLYALLGTAIDSLDPGNEYGRQKPATTALKGAASGAALGSYLGPIGTVAGAVVGGGLGAFAGTKARKQEQAMRLTELQTLEELNARRGAAAVAADPSLVMGNRGAQYYANGGQLARAYHSKTKAFGGDVVPMSSTAAEIKGPSHSQGGVKLPEFGSEVEGKETLEGDYVFSDRLGFAERHKKLARAIGSIEKKPATVERINSLRIMKEEVENLKMAQEYIRQTNNL